MEAIIIWIILGFLLVPSFIKGVAQGVSPKKETTKENNKEFKKKEYHCTSCQRDFDKSEGYYEDGDIHCPNCDSDDIVYN